MANFITRVLKLLAAIVTAYFLLFFLLFLGIVGITVFFQPEPLVVQEDTVLVLDLGMNISDSPKADDMAEIIGSALQGEIVHSASLREVLNGIRDARKDSQITGLLLTGNLLPGGSGTSLAGMREIRREIQLFAEDKPVWAYINNDSLRDIYIKSVASEVISDPYATVDFRGLRAERLYLGEAFERIGVEVQIEAIGEYKSAGESLKRSSMSDQERLQLEEILSDLWSVISSDIAESRGLDADSLDTLANSELMLAEKEILSGGLSDRQLSRDDLIAFLSEAGAYDVQNKTFRQIDFIDYLSSTAPVIPSMNLMGGESKIAVIYADGIIMDGESDDGIVGSETLIQYLREARLDDSVKAIVLRVNSPGGGAAASFKVAREITRTNAEKPVVASVAGVAASGGYLISAPCEDIVIEPSSLTGSIGVVIMIPNIEATAEKLSLSFESVQTHQFGGAYSLARSKTPEEMAQFRKQSVSYYEEFLRIVSEGRGLSLEETLPLAGGRVWSGAAALENGLADRQGGLLESIQRAADLAGIGNNYSIMEKPRRMSLEEQIEDFLTYSGISRITMRKQGYLEEAFMDFRAEFERISQMNDPHSQYTMLPYSLKIR